MTPATAELRTVTARRATVDIVLQLVGRGLSIVVGMVTTVVIVRALGERGYGQWSTVFAIVAIIGYLGDLGLNQIAVRHAAAEREREGVWLGALLTLRVALAIPVSAVTVVVVLLIAKTSEMRTAGLILVFETVVAGVAIGSAIFQLRMRNAFGVSFDVAAGLLWGVTALIVIASGGGMVPLAIAFSASTLAVLAVQLAVALRMAPVRFRGATEGWRELVVVGVPVAMSSLLYLAYARIDQVLVFELAGDRAAGLYGAAFRIYERAHVVPAVVLTTVFPLLAAAHLVDPARMRKLVQATLEALTAIALPTLAFAAVTAEPLCRALFGEEFVEAAPALVILTGSFCFTALGYLASNLVIILAAQRRYLIYAVVGLVINVGLNLLLIPPLGFVAAAWVTVITQAAVILPTLAFTLPAVGYRLEAGRPVRIALAAAGMGLVVAGLRLAGVPLGALVAAAAVSYPALLLALGALGRETIDLLRRRS